ncbi:hypothetical protein EVAR_21276_1 [Eumeta japonica]|uniref:Uncharacterized protein n=1 Tax=Eumeta variegata TaxID=151549 RepID=A0A4C1WPW5_EUMVA|nr:hypothetical protein EVAR_21276_1 [Eumeta japonica]
MENVKLQRRAVAKRRNYLKACSNLFEAKHGLYTGLFQISTGTNRARPTAGGGAFEPFMSPGRRRPRAPTLRRHYRRGRCYQNRSNLMTRSRVPTSRTQKPLLLLIPNTCAINQDESDIVYEDICVEQESIRKFPDFDLKHYLKNGVTRVSCRGRASLSSVKRAGASRKCDQKRNNEELASLNRQQSVEDSSNGAQWVGSTPALGASHETRSRDCQRRRQRRRTE